MIYEKVTGRRYYPVIREFDSHVGWTLKPNRLFELVGDEWHSKVETNELGFRGALPEPDERNLLVLGDSNTVSLRTDYGETFLGLLDRQRDDYNVWNMAVGGWASINQYLALRRFASEFSPDFVLFQLYLQNGVSENAKFAVIDGKQVCIDGSKLPATLPEERDESRLKKMAREVVTSDPRLLKLSESVGLVDRGHPLTAYKRTYGDHLTSGLEKTKTLVSRAASFCAERDIGFGVVAAPSPWQVSERWLADAVGEYDLNRDTLDLRKPDEAIASLCDERGINFHDMYDRLDDEPDDVYFENMDHWNAEGHAVVADQLNGVLDEWL